MRRRDDISAAALPSLPGRPPVRIVAPALRRWMSKLFWEGFPLSRTAHGKARHRQFAWESGDASKGRNRFRSMHMLSRHE